MVITRQLRSVLCTAALLAVAVGCSWRRPVADPLEDTSWQLVSYAEEQVLAGSQVTASFQEGRVGGTAGCNSYGGSYEVQKDKVTFGALFSTKMFCHDPDGVMNQEQTFLNLLGAATTFRLEGATLTIVSTGGEALVFEREP